MGAVTVTVKRLTKKLSTYLHLVPALRMMGAIPSLRHINLWRALGQLYILFSLYGGFSYTRNVRVCCALFEQSEYDFALYFHKLLLERKYS
jgi:hypothetical protein